MEAEVNIKDQFEEEEVKVQEGGEVVDWVSEETQLLSELVQDSKKIILISVR